MKIFQNRKAAGQALAAEVAAFAPLREAPCCVLALPRGGVPVAYEIAEALNAPLDVFVVRKLGVPWYPELAFGAVASGDVQILNQGIIEQWAISTELVDAIVAHEREELNRRERLYRGDRPPLDVHGTNVIVVDDGMATGATMLAAIKALRQCEPRRLIVAVPVAPTQTCRLIRERVDKLICLDEPPWFDAVGSSYQDFRQVTDEEVQALLNRRHETSMPLAQLP